MKFQEQPENSEAGFQAQILEQKELPRRQQLSKSFRRNFPLRPLKIL